MKAGDLLRQAGDYKGALNKYNAAKLCQSDKSSQVDQRISEVFGMIEGEKNTAIAQKKIADQEREKAKRALKTAEVAKAAALANEQIAKEARNEAIASADTARSAKEQAQKDAHEAQALVWANDSDKLPADTAIRLLEKAAEYNLKAVPVYERLFRRFN